MVIRSRTIRLGIFISTFIIAAIIIFQLVWLRKIYYYEQKQFDHGIARSVRAFYEDVDEPYNQYLNLNQLIENPNPQTFIIHTGKPKFAYDSIAFYMQSELEDQDIFTDCYLAIYDAASKRYTFSAYLPAAASFHKKRFSLPVANQDFDHITLYFPHRSQYILSLMNFWIIGTVILMVALLLLSGSLYYFYRQKFLNEIQKDFVNNFTHEFKTPVSVINLAADVLAKPNITQNPVKVATYANIVQYQVKYLQQQIERLLHYAHAENNFLQLHREELDLHELIDEALKNLQPMIHEKHATIECRLDAERPFLSADKGYLLIVVTNLIENALKYSKEPKIVISTSNDGANIYFSVKDNGNGIDKKYREKIFRKFYRVPNGEQMAARGFGLGLAFVKRIVLSHYGKITVESVPGIGSDFQVKLPV